MAAHSNYGNSHKPEHTDRATREERGIMDRASTVDLCGNSISGEIINLDI